MAVNLSSITQPLPLVIGTSAANQAYTAGTPIMEIYATNAGTSGSTSAEPIYIKSVLTGAGQVGGRCRFHTYSNVASGGWVNALKGYMEFGASGSTSGLASAVCAELSLPGAANSGTYAPLEVELVTPENCTVSTASMMYFNVTGHATALTNFNTNGYLFQLGAGIVDTADGLFDVINADDIDANACLRILIGSTPYFIPLSTVNTFNA